MASASQRARVQGPPAERSSGDCRRVPMTASWTRSRWCWLQVAQGALGVLDAGQGAASDQHVRGDGVSDDQPPADWVSSRRLHPMSWTVTAAAGLSRSGTAKGSSAWVARRSKRSDPRSESRQPSWATRLCWSTLCRPDQAGSAESISRVHDGARRRPRWPTRSCWHQRPGARRGLGSASLVVVRAVEQSGCMVAAGVSDGLALGAPEGVTLPVCPSMFVSASARRSVTPIRPDVSGYGVARGFRASITTRPPRSPAWPHADASR